MALAGLGRGILQWLPPSQYIDCVVGRGRPRACTGLRLSSTTLNRGYNPG
uniref:Uncharacterized protein n=1 Tax=Anguilla anguilla TaxID=7936 RepID=A0A0E9SSZ8_ANGAN